VTRVAPLPRRLRAFTLVEVLAALTLAAIILPVAMRGVSLAIAASDDARRRLEAAALAETQLTDLLVTDAWQTADLSGEFGSDWPDYTWTAAVSDWNGVTTLRQVTIQVKWTARSRERSVTLTTLVYTGGR